MVKVDHIAHDLVLPEGVTATVSGTILKVTKGSNSIERDFTHPKIEVRNFP